MGKLNKNAQKLVKVLESGRYKQGRNFLRPDSNSYCCLGVACDLYRKEHKNRWVKKPGSNLFSFKGKKIELPIEVMDWLGFNTDEGAFYNDEFEYSTLSVLNDDGCSFKDIAKLIKSKPQGLFK